MGVDVNSWGAIGLIFVGDVMSSYTREELKALYMDRHGKGGTVGDCVMHVVCADRERENRRWDGTGWHGRYKDACAENLRLRVALEQACALAETAWDYPNASLPGVETMRKNRKELLG